MQSQYAEGARAGPFLASVCSFIRVANGVLLLANMFYEHPVHGPVIPPQIQTYNSLGIQNLSLIKRRHNLRGIAQRIQTAMGLRDHREEKFFHLTVTSGEHFGRSVKMQPDAPVVLQAAMRLSQAVPFTVDPETLLWEEVDGYEHRIPSILTTVSRGMQQLDAFRLENVFGMPVPQRKLDEIRNNIKNGHSTTVDHGGLLAALLKLWLQKLPHPLLELDGTDGMLMREVLQGVQATGEQIQAVLAVNNHRNITSVQRCVCTYVLNLLAVTVESGDSITNTPRGLAKQIVYPLCHKRPDSRAGKLAIRFLEQCIKYQMECRRCEPDKFVPCGSITPVMRKFLSNMLIRADNMHIHLGQVEDLEKSMTNDKLIAAVEGRVQAPEQKARERGMNESLSGQYILEKTASPFHIPAAHLKPFYNEWKVGLRADDFIQLI